MIFYLIEKFISIKKYANRKQFTKFKYEQNFIITFFIKIKININEEDFLSEDEDNTFRSYNLNFNESIEIPSKLQSSFEKLNSQLEKLHNKK